MKQAIFKAALVCMVIMHAQAKGDDSRDPIKNKKFGAALAATFVL